MPEFSELQNELSTVKTGVEPNFDFFFAEHPTQNKLNFKTITML